MHPDDSKNLALHVSLFNKTLELVQQTNLPYIIVDEQLQQGDTFAEKFCNAIDYSLAKGIDNLITIGSDCAALTKKNILEASEALLKRDAIVGKDNHNGIYLLGFKRKLFSRKEFLTFKWGSNQLFNNVVQYFSTKQNVEPYILKVRIDLNHFKDLQKVVEAFATSSFIKLLITFLQQSIQIFAETEQLVTTIFTLHKTYRGPPQM